MLKYSKSIHVLTLLTFLLPFFYTGCESKESIEEKEKQASNDVVAIDSIPTQSLQDTFTLNNFKEEEAIKSLTEKSTTDNFKNKTEGDNSELLSERIVKHSPALKPLLVPDKDTYSGIGYILDSYAYYSAYCLPIAFLLIVICFIIKFIEPNSIKSIAILNAFSLIFLLISNPLSVFSEPQKKWGFWVCVVVLTLQITYDTFLLFKYLKSNKKSTINNV